MSDDVRFTIIPARICERCKDNQKEAFPYGAHDLQGKHWEILCNECFEDLGCLYPLETITTHTIGPYIIAEKRFPDGSPCFMPFATVGNRDLVGFFCWTLDAALTASIHYRAKGHHGAMSVALANHHLGISDSLPSAGADAWRELTAADLEEDGN